VSGKRDCTLPGTSPISVVHRGAGPLVTEKGGGKTRFQVRNDYGFNVKQLRKKVCPDGTPEQNGGGGANHPCLDRGGGHHQDFITREPFRSERGDEQKPVLKSRGGGRGSTIVRVADELGGDGTKTGMGTQATGTVGAKNIGRGSGLGGANRR